MDFVYNIKMAKFINSTLLQMRNDINNMPALNSLIVDLQITYPAQPVSLDVVYNNILVHNGDTFTINSTSNQPIVTYDYSDGYYTLIMVDPDVYSRTHPDHKYGRHWIVANNSSGNFTQGDILTTYLGPAPPLDSGFHRYAFLLLRQKNLLPDDPIDTSRVDWNVSSFISDNNLTLVGLKYFQAENAS